MTDDTPYRVMGGNLMQGEAGPPQGALLDRAGGVGRAGGRGWGRRRSAGSGWLRRPGAARGGCLGQIGQQLVVDRMGDRRPGSLVRWRRVGGSWAIPGSRTATDSK